tara:strand:- start:4805 stop:5716 length:912 start_codon:yes stop_codon:yes gene_type:complete
MKLKHIETANGKKIRRSGKSASKAPAESSDKTQAPLWSAIKERLMVLLLGVSEKFNQLNLTPLQRRTLLVAAGVIPVLIPIFVIALGNPPKETASLMESPVISENADVQEADEVAETEKNAQVEVVMDDFSQPVSSEIPMDPIIARLTAAEEAIVTVGREDHSPDFVETDPFDTGENLAVSEEGVSADHRLEKLAELKASLEGEWFAFDNSEIGQDSSLNKVGLRLAKFDHLANELGVNYKVTIRTFSLEQSSVRSTGAIPANRVRDAIVASGASASTFGEPNRRGLEVLIDVVEGLSADEQS